MDYDGDGDLDLLSGSYTGELYLFLREADGTFAQGHYLNDGDGAPLMVGTSVTVEAIDMDGDGDLDLVVGTRSEGARIVDNLGTRTEPRWAPKPRQLMTRSGKKVNGSNAHVVDWDRDGVLDLVLGSERGGAHWHRNEGSNAAPAYADAVDLVAPSDTGQGLHPGDTPQAPGSRTKVFVGDWNHDGVLDLLIGDASWVYYELPPLSEAERAEQEALRPEYERAKAEQKTLLEERNSYVKARKPIPKEYHDRYDAMSARLRPIFARWSAFGRERTEVRGWVWLYPGTAPKPAGH